MSAQLLLVLPTLGTALALALLVHHLNASLCRRLDALERRLEEAAAGRVATLHEELLAQRLSTENLGADVARLGREVERLGADVVNRELYRSGTPRHGDAISAVRRGGDLRSLVREHGLPLEEAELLMSLYAGASEPREETI